MARVTIAGGGIAALEAVLALRDLAGDVDIELLAPRAAGEYRPLAVLEPFALGETPVLGLDRFVSEQKLAWRRDTLVAVEPRDRVVVTGQGERQPYEVLLVAAGARVVEPLPGAITFRGHDDARRLALVLDEVAGGGLRRIAFAVPADQAWSLPAYELALLAAATLHARKARDFELSVVSAEERPLLLFGAEASDVVARLLDEAGIDFRGGDGPQALEQGALLTTSGARILTDRVLTLPRLVGPRFPGLPSNDEGFVRTEATGQVPGLEDVYAAGDVTDFPVKQGGLATQQADAAAESIAARLGGDVNPEPFRPVLRGMLLTGAAAQPLDEERGAGAKRPTLFAASRKVSGRYLLPYLSGSDPDEPAVREGALQVELDLEPLRPPAP